MCTCTYTVMDCFVFFIASCVYTSCNSRMFLTLSRLSNVVYCEVSYGWPLGVCGWYITWDDDTQDCRTSTGCVCCFPCSFPRGLALSSLKSAVLLRYPLPPWCCTLSSLEFDLSGPGIPPAEPVGAVQQIICSVQCTGENGQVEVTSHFSYICVHTVLPIYSDTSHSFNHSLMP